jgi:hypothetical protein
LQVNFFGGVLLALLGWTALIGSVALLGPSLLLLLIPLDFTRKLYRLWNGFIAYMWFGLATLLLEKWAKVYHQLLCFIFGFSFFHGPLGKKCGRFAWWLFRNNCFVSLQIRVVITGSDLPRGEPAMIISNHR